MFESILNMSMVFSKNKAQILKKKIKNRGNFMYSAFCKFAYCRSFMTKFKSVFNKKRLFNMFEPVPSILKHVKKVLL